MELGAGIKQAVLGEVAEEGLCNAQEMWAEGKRRRLGQVFCCRSRHKTKGLVLEEQRER